MDRRKRRREISLTHTRRRYPRLFLDVEWFVESMGCSTLGRGLEISPRGALLPVTCLGPFSATVTLHVSLPSRPRMFRAEGVATPRPDRGWAILFRSVSLEDLQLLALTLVEHHGLDALAASDRKPSKFFEFEQPEAP